jgi:hypothetical protein
VASRAERLAARAEKRAARRGRRGGLLMGVAAGVAIGLLVAPKSGKETRAMLFGEGGLGAQVDRVRGALGAGKDSAAGQSEELKRRIEETRERLRRQMDLGGEPAVGGEPGSGDAPGAAPDAAAAI